MKTNRKKQQEKKKNSRLTLSEKIQICTLLGTGHSLAETAEIISKRTKKKVSMWRVRHYWDSPRWASYIRSARKSEIANAEKIPVFSTVGRIRKYDKLLQVFETKFFETLKNIETDNPNTETTPAEEFKILSIAAKYMLKILAEVREEEYEAIVKKGGSSEDQDELEDFFMLIERRVIASRRRRDPDRELERAAGLL